jgi:hypothetical protein
MRKMPRTINWVERCEVNFGAKARPGWALAVAGETGVAGFTAGQRSGRVDAGKGGMGGKETGDRMPRRRTGGRATLPHGRAAEPLRFGAASADGLFEPDDDQPRSPSRPTSTPIRGDPPSVLRAPPATHETARPASGGPTLLLCTPPATPLATCETRPTPPAMPGIWPTRLRASKTPPETPPASPQAPSPELFAPSTELGARRSELFTRRAKLGARCAALLARHAEF